MVDYRFSLLSEVENNSIALKEFLDFSFMEIEEFKKEFILINKRIKDLNYEQLSLYQETIYIPKIFKERWLDIYLGSDDYSIFIHENQRRSMIYLMVFMNAEELSVFHFQDFLNVSKNTILKDIKKLREILSFKNINLLYSRKKGFYILGNEIDIRSFAYSSLNMLLENKVGESLLYNYLYIIDSQLYAIVQLNLIKIRKSFHMTVVPSRFDEMSNYLSVLFLRIKFSDVSFDIPDEKLIINLKMYKTVSEFLKYFEIDFNSSDMSYITVLFMTCTQGDLSDSSLDFLMDCCCKITYEIERFAAIHFKNFKKILIELFYHLVPSYFRILYDLSIDNVLLNQIKVQYRELYELTSNALFPLESLTKRTIPSEEVGYYTILFGGEILSQRERSVKRNLEAVIICPSGISSSVIMKSELQKLFPNINFRESNSIKNFKYLEVETSVDIVFSSIPVKSQKKVYIINPIMSQLEKSLLVRTIQEDFYLNESHTPTVNEILDIIIPHIEIKKGMTRNKLYNMIENKINKNILKKEDNRPVLSELLTEDTIQIVDSQQDWESAIAYAAEPLKSNGAINGNYITAMIQKVKDYGPFINIGKDVALPHARPEDGVEKLGMSLLKIDSPVLLCNDEKHPVKIFICLAAVDNETHLRALASLTKILSNKEKLERLLKASTKSEIIKIINEGEDE